MRCPICKENDNTLFHNKVWNDDKKKVYHCVNCDVVFLWPQMSNSEEREFYKQYNKNVAERRIKISNKVKELHESSLRSARERYKLISEYFNDVNSVCEIGGATGAFLQLLRGIDQKFIIEPNDRNRNFSKKYSNKQYEYIDNLPKSLKFDIVCMFHTFEHIRNPFSFLSKCKSHMKKKGKLIMEIPHIKDPLIFLYDCIKFKDYYFQAMHPYVYSQKSIRYIMDKSGLSIERFIFKQRYGLDNHLNWLTKGEPGGNSFFENLFQDVTKYKKILEQRKITDTIFIIAVKN